LHWNIYKKNVAKETKQIITENMKK